LDTSTGIQSRIPPGTAAFITIAVFMAAIQELHPAWLGLAERDPERIAAGEWWRVVTALLAYDDGAVQKLGIVFGALVLGIAAERRIGSVEWLIVAFVSGLAGQIAGLWWQPYGAGSSVAVAGLLGATATWLAWPKMPRADGERGEPGASGRLFPWFARIGAVVVFALAVALVVVRDIQGPPIFVGAALAALFRFLHRDG
jgi:rhomboid protease GluP